jgi:hypothetical protein
MRAEPRVCLTLGRPSCTFPLASSEDAKARDMEAPLRVSSRAG